MSKLVLTAEELNMIQAYRTVAQQKGAANASGNNGSNQNESKPKRSYQLQPVYKVLLKARRLNQRQVTQETDNRAKCVDIVLATSESLYPDPSQFKLDFQAESDRLTDSKRFCRECEALGMDPATVADNIAFEGKIVLEKVLKEGLQFLGERVKSFDVPLWNDAEEVLEDLPAEFVNEEGANA
jgi:hypothetical protein